MDMRQIIAALLTLSMFMMVGNMVKKDYFDSYDVNSHSLSSVKYEAITVSKQSLVATNLPAGANNWLWNEERNGESVKPCWQIKPSVISKEETVRSKGYIIFSLTNGPEYHVSQIVDAVVVARYLGATLVLPEIRGSRPGERRKFGEIYNVNKFVKSLDGIVTIAKEKPEVGNFTTVRVPNRVSEGYISTNIQPIFLKKRYLRVETYFPSSTMEKGDKVFEKLDPFSCLAMFETLELQSELHEAADLLVDRLRALSQKSSGRFVAVDLRAEMSERKECGGNGAISGRKWCHDAKEIGEFLKKVEFDRNTTIYLTHTGWSRVLDPLRDVFPNTYTKEDIMPEDKKMKFLKPQTTEFAKVMDFHICTESDVFVPSMSGMFYSNVVGRRIASGKSQVLVPSTRNDSSASAYLSPYISKKSHLAYSCFC